VDDIARIEEFLLFPNCKCNWIVERFDPRQMSSDFQAGSCFRWIVSQPACSNDCDLMTSLGESTTKALDVFFLSADIREVVRAELGNPQSCSILLLVFFLEQTETSSLGR